MSNDTAVSGTMPDDAGTPRSARPYVSPAITPLGTLSDLTLGGLDGVSDDGFGTAGDTGSI